MTKGFTKLERIVNDELNKHNVFIEPQTAMHEVVRYMEESYYTYRLEFYTSRSDVPFVKLHVRQDEIEVHLSFDNKLVIKLTNGDGFDLLIDHVRSLFSVDFWLRNRGEIQLDLDGDETTIEKLEIDDVTTLIDLIKNCDVDFMEMNHWAVNFYDNLHLARMEKVRSLDEATTLYMDDLMLKAVSDLVSTTTLEFYKITETLNGYDYRELFVLLEVPNFMNKNVLTKRHAFMTVLFGDL